MSSCFLGGTRHTPQAPSDSTDSDISVPTRFLMDLLRESASSSDIWVLIPLWRWNTTHRLSLFSPALSGIHQLPTFLLFLALEEASQACFATGESWDGGGAGPL